MMDLDIIDRYQENAYNLYMQMHPTANPVRVKELINERVMRTYKDPVCQLDNNVTHVTIDTTISNAINWIEYENPIITGNGTFFKQHAEYLSPTVRMLEALMDKRGVIKKAMFTFPKGSVGYKNKYCGQINVKVIMNADYGGAGTTLSPFYSKYIPPATTSTAKNITTTLICCLELASSNNDRWCILNSINELFDFIHAVLTDTEDRELIDAVYTVDAVVKRLSDMMYMPTGYEVMMITKFVETLSIADRTKLMLAYNVKECLRTHLSVEISSIMAYLKNHQLNIDNITPENINESGFGVKPPAEIADLINKVIKTVCDNCIYRFIPNDVEARCERMHREVVCVTDTDSLMVHFAHFIPEFQSNIPGDFKASCLLASAIGVRLYIDGIIPKFVEYISLGMNINDKKYRDKFIFKNEFIFLEMALFAKKMYASSTFVQEGSPRDIHDIAVTGMSFKKRDAAEFLEPLMLEMFDKYVLTSNRIDVSSILQRYYDVRNEIYQNARHSAEYFKVLSLKDQKAYVKSKTLPAQMRGSLIWNAMFPDQEMLPMDRVKLIPISWDLMQEHHNEDPRIEECMRLCLADDPTMKKDQYICIPNHFTETPDWIAKIMDLDTLVDKLLSPFKQMFGLFGIHMSTTKGGMIPSRMVYP